MSRSRQRKPAKLAPRRVTALAPRSVGAELLDHWNAGKGMHTVEARLRDLTAFGIFAFKSPDPLAAALGLLGLGASGAKRKVLEWIKDMVDEGLADTTRARRVVTLRTLVDAAIELATERGHGSWKLLVAPPKFKKYQRASGPPAKNVEKEIEKLAASASKTAVRDLALVLLCYDVGLRISEACSLQIRAIDWHRDAKGKPGSSVKVRRKRDKIEKRTISMRCKTALLAQIRDRKTGLVFPGRKEGLTLHRRSGYDVFKRLGLGHPHAMRHSAGTKLYLLTKDLQLVQEFLGHADISTTQVYVQSIGDRAGEGSRILAGEMEEGEGR